MSPCLELVRIQGQESFTIWTHGYPYETVRWHFHPEYELSFITHTEGRFFVGDHVGSFGPGQLVLVGPNLPHNWISDVPAGQHVPLRCIVLQFSGDCVERGIAAFPELAHLQALLDDARRGVLFTPEVAAPAAQRLQQMLRSSGFERLQLFLGLLDELARAQGNTLLATPSFEPDPSHYQRSTINQVLAYMVGHVGEPLSESDVARYAGMLPSSFSRFFRRQTGVPFIQYLNRLRVQRACELLLGSQLSVTDICYACGFNNVSNFNRRFLALQSMSPSQYRRRHRAMHELAEAAA